MKPTTLIIFLATLAGAAGCSARPASIPTPDTMWGPGVADPALHWKRIEQIASKKTDPERARLATSLGNAHYKQDDLFLIARGMLLTMTWRQAAGLYPSATGELRPWLCVEIIQGQEIQFNGMTRAQVLNLLGEPDEQGAVDDEWGGTWAMTYNGYGYVSDSTGALVLYFDKRGVYLRIGYPS